MKRSFWIALCLLPLLLVWLLWPSGGQPAAVKQSAVVASSPTSAAAVVAAAAHPFSVAAQAAGYSAASTNREFFRLTNTSKTIGELANTPHAILLENALIDTAAKLDLKIPAQLRATGEPGAYIVQARGLVDAPFRALLASVGAQIISYIPNNAYLVQLSAGGAAALAANAQVQAVLPFEPYYKIQASLLGLAVEQKPLPPAQVLTLGLYAAGADDTVAQIEKMGGAILATDRSPFGPVVRVRPPADWIALAQLPGVQRVEPATRRKVANDLARVALGISTNTVTSVNWLGLNGKNVLVEVNDTGIDPGHPDFSTTGSAGAPGPNPPSRVTGDTATSLYDTSGHGTHVAGVIAGNGGESYKVPQIPRGSVTNADFRGKAPLAKLFSVGFLGANDTNEPYISDKYLQEMPALTNALISNNSWDNGANEYDLEAASYDAAVRDAVPEMTGPQPVLFVFAAGNDGNGADSGSAGYADTITSPGTAKNVVTVGALEQYRLITNVVTALDGSSNAVWEGETDSGTQVAWYSSRGNVGVGTEGTYGRFKPDVVAPGTFVVSTRPSMWDQVAYYSPTNYDDSNSSYGLVATTNALAYGGAGNVPLNAVAVTITVAPNSLSPVPFPTNMPIYISATTVPTATSYDFATSNNVMSIPPGGGTLTGIGSLYNGFNIGVGDGTNIPVNFDLIIQITTTNDLGNQLTVLSNLNTTLGPYYYYESGTSIAAPAISGTLALIQDFFTNTLHSTPSPALLKAMLINGARLTTGYNFYGVTNTINFEGWGLANVPNSVPTNLPTSTANTVRSMYFLDQSPTNALATGDSQTFNVNVPSANARAQMLHVTLAWTDPPGNPVAGIKLVNNLDLVVTNLGTGQVYYGNNFASASIPFSVPVNANTTPDNVNNVENVFLPAPLGTNYSVTVIGRNVAVNAVTAEQTNIVQDYALVVSCGDGANTSGISVSPAAKVSSTVPLVTYVGGSTNGVYFNQVSGANAPWLSTNALLFGTNYGFATNSSLYIGQTNQWHFYVVTNTTTYSNAAFVIFDPNTLAIPREGVFAGSDANSTTPEADLDLFVTSPTSDPNAASLTNLNPVVISNCVYAVNGDQASLSRGGTKFIVYSNAAPNQVYYVGVQCEDQTAAQFGFIPVFSQNSFSQTDSNGNQVVYGLGLPTDIPDGDNANPGSVSILALATIPMQVASVTVTNSVITQNSGDLIGTLTHEATDAILNNHTGLQGGFTNVYNDNGLPGTSHTDGPGSLDSFVGTQAVGPWFLTEVDDSAALNGSVTAFSLLIQPHKNLNAQGGITVTVPPGGWFYDYVDVAAGDTNMIVVATNITIPPQLRPPVQLYLAYQTQPAVSNYLAEADLNLGTPPGNSISYGPPLAPGRYFIGLFNPGLTPQTVVVGVNLAFNASAVTTLDFDSAGPVPLVDDAVTTNSIMVNNTNFIQGFNVGLCVAHPRISDLVFTLISPAGSRYLLMENRGGQSTNGCGAEIITTNNFPPVNASGGAAPQTNSYNVGQTSGKFPITYNFYTVPDEMTVYYGSNVTSAASLILDTGFTNNPALSGYTNGTAGTNTSPEVLTVSFPPPGVQATSSYLTIVMNQFGNYTNPTTGQIDTNTAWTYTAGGVLTNFEYLAFTEDTNLTTTPIKFAPPPLVPPINSANNALISSNNGWIQWTIASGGNGHWYRAVVNINNLDWLQADSIAHNDGAYLATITSQAENDFVYGLINKNPAFFSGNYPNGSGPAIGGVNPISGLITNDWSWETGEPWAYTDWGSGLPNNPGPARLHYFSGTQGVPAETWDDIDPADSNMGGYVEEFNPSPVSYTNLYYLPEQSLDPLIGTSAYGEWTLEVLDDRAGATNPAPQLLSWQLEFTFANTNLPPTLPTLTNGIPQTNTVAAGGIDWYQVNVPTNADFATNTLLFATNLPVNLWFSTNAPPTTNSPGDVKLLSNVSSGSSTLGTNTSSYPYIVEGGTYYLGVQNTNSLAVTFALEVNFHLFGLPPMLGAVANQYVVAGNPFVLTNTATDYNAGLLAYTLVTTPPVSATISTNGVITWFTATNTPAEVVAFTTVVTNSITGLGATNSFNVTVLPLLFTNTPQTNVVVAGGLNWYAVNVPTNADFATNILEFATNLPVNVLFTTNFPPTTNFATGLILNSTNATNVLSTSSSPAIVPGNTYYLGVQNTNAVSVTYALEVNFHLIGTNSLNAVTISSIVHTNGGFLLTWFAPSNYLFQVQWTTLLVPATWHTFTNVVSYNVGAFTSPTNTQFNFFDDGSQTGGFGATRFYRLINLLATNTLTLPYQGNLTVASSAPVTVTNTAVDSRANAVLTYVLTNAPDGASISSNGIITWTAAPAGLAARFTTIVTDDSVPPLTASNQFTIFVSPPPSIANVTVTATNAVLSWFAPTNDQFNVRWTTNLAPTIVWTTFPTIITSSTGLFNFTDTNAPLVMKFYQLILLP